MRRVATAVAAAALLWPAAAHAARWRLTGVTPIPLVYYQGVAASPGGRLFFDGVFAGLYRADRHLAQRVAQPQEIPPAVTAAEGFNHIGDITWDRREGGRVLLPLECYTPGAPHGGNTCGHGAFGVADATTLRWRYRVRLDPRQIPKAMWAEVSPDGRLVWTSAGRDLLAYRAAAIKPGARRPLRAVRRLRRAVPPTGVTGATFYRGRLLLAGQRGGLFEVWSVDVAGGRRRLEIRRHMSGESEGLAIVGGALRWIVTPFDPAGRPPTYPGPGNALLSFRPGKARRRRP